MKKVHRPQRQKPRNGAKRMVMQPEYRQRKERSHKAYHRPSANRQALTRDLDI